MATILVDSNVLFDLMTQDARWFAWSSSAMAQAADRFRLVINPVIYAEVSVRHSRIEELDEALSKTLFDRDALPYEAAFLAGKAHEIHRPHCSRNGLPGNPPYLHILIFLSAMIASTRV